MARSSQVSECPEFPRYDLRTGEGIVGVAFRAVPCGRRPMSERDTESYRHTADLEELQQDFARVDRIAPVEQLLAVNGVVELACIIDRVDLIWLQDNVVCVRGTRIVGLVHIAYPVLPKISGIVEIVAREV